MSENKKQCVGCNAMITAPNFAKHKRRCELYKKTGDYAESNMSMKDKMEQMSKKIKELEIEKQEHKIQLEKANYKIEFLEKQVSLLSTQPKQQINNFEITNNFYVMDANGLRNGLDMNKLRSFGSENIDYVDPSKPLPTILKNIYCNKDHLENQVLSHKYLNLQWILFKYEDHVLALNLGIDDDNMHVMVKLIVENVQRLLNKEFPNVEERWDAVRELLWQMNKEVDEMCDKLGNNIALDKLPIWNKDQFKGCEERIWQRYMDLANYSQQLKRIDTKKWDCY